MAAAPRSRLAFLDSLRAWAAMYVVVYHTALIPSPALHVPAWAGPIVLTGGTGVTLFFVASAFSLCRAARPGEGAGRELAAYGLRRFFRIAPLFYAVLAASLLRDLWIFGASHNATEILLNLVLVFNLWPGHEAGIVWASWTIGVEVVFYVAFPFLVTRLTSVAAAALVLLVLLLTSASWSSALHWHGVSQPVFAGQIQFGALRYLPVFGFGVLSYRLFERFVEPKPVTRQAGGAVILCSVYLYISLINGRVGPAPFMDDLYWQGVIYSAFLLGLSMYPARLIVNRVTQYIGKISYSLYLVHPIVVYALIPVDRAIEAWAGYPTVSFLLCAAMTLSVAIAIASVTYVMIERPGMALGRRLEAGLVLRGKEKAVLF